ncbi:MAG: DUF1751 domain-containing protein [Deltaproteobacteria bacterium]|nr:DUF1751 domain-containing protein [Deltaproteobacteria bacterium]
MARIPRSQVERWLNPRSSAAQMALLYLALTVAAHGLSPTFLSWIELVPAAVRELQLWRVLSYVFVGHKDVLSLIFAILLFTGVGAELEASWGRRRLWLFAAGVGVGAGVLVVLLSLVMPRIAYAQFLGDWTVPTAMWVAYGLLAGPRQMNFWSLPVTGYTFALIGVGFTVLNGLFGSFYSVLPDLFAIALTFLHIWYRFPDVIVHKFKAWQFQRDFSKRSRHLRAVEDEQRNMPRDSDRFLH